MGNEISNEVAANVAELQWEAAPGYPSGTQWKVLCRGSAGEPKTVLLKLPPGFEMLAHSHVYAEQHYVMDGEYSSPGGRYPAGTYRCIPAHMDHGPFHSSEGAELLVIWED